MKNSPRSGGGGRGSSSQYGLLTSKVRGQQREWILRKDGPGLGRCQQQQQQQQQGHEVGSTGHPVRGSSGPRGYPLTHMLVLKRETEKSSSERGAGRSPPGLSPEDPGRSEKVLPLGRCPRPQPAVAVTQGPPLSNQRKLAAVGRVCTDPR